MIVLSKIGDGLDFRGSDLRIRHPGRKMPTTKVSRLTWRSSTTIIFRSLPVQLTMATRASGSTTALRRLMTEYKQLTASGTSVCVVYLHHFTDLQHCLHRLAR